MTKQFWIFLAVGLAVVGALVSTVMVGTKSAHLELTGSVLKVRTVALNETAALVMLDFRVTNPSGVPFVVSNVSLTVEPLSGDLLVGTIASKSDVDNILRHQKLAGPKFNDVLTLRDRVNPRETVDRMIAARIEVPEAILEKRKTIRIKLEDVDGTVAEIVERP